jgi:hypothetical protein
LAEYDRNHKTKNAQSYSKCFWEAFDRGEKCVYQPWPKRYKWWREALFIQEACRKYKNLEPLIIELNYHNNYYKPDSCEEMLKGTKYECTKTDYTYAILRRGFCQRMATLLKVSTITIKRLVAELVKCELLKTFNLGGRKGIVICAGYYQFNAVLGLKEGLAEGSTERGFDYGTRIRPFLKKANAHKLKNFRI